MSMLRMKVIHNAMTFCDNVIEQDVARGVYDRATGEAAKKELRKLSSVKLLQEYSMQKEYATIMGYKIR